MRRLLRDTAISDVQQIEPQKCLAFGNPPTEQPPELCDYRQRHAWEQAHTAAAKALELHPERPTVQRPPPQLHRDIGLDLGR